MMVQEHPWKGVTMNKSISHLMVAVLQEQDIELATSALAQFDVPVIRLTSTGGFLKLRNTTLLIGINDELAVKVISTLQKTCRQRVEYMAVPLEGSNLPLPMPVPVMVGGAKVFVIPVEQFEEI